MSFATDLAKLVDYQLWRFTKVNKYQLAGQAANIDFWLAQVRHCFEVIDGYGERFQRLKNAEADYFAKHPDPRLKLPRRVPPQALREARRCLGDAAWFFLLRCYHEGFIGEPRLRQACAEVGIAVDPTELKSPRAGH